MEAYLEAQKVKQRAVPTHPGYKEMIVSAIKSLNDKKGSSRHAIKKFIESNFEVKVQGFATHLGRNLKKLVESGYLIHPKLAPGSFKIDKERLAMEEKKAKAIAKVMLKKEAAKSKLEEKKAKTLEKKKTAKKTAAKKPVQKEIKKASVKKSVKKTTDVSKNSTKKPIKKAPKKPVAKKVVKKTVAKKTPKKTVIKKATKAIGPK